MEKRIFRARQKIAYIVSINGIKGRVEASAKLKTKTFATSVFRPSFFVMILPTRTL
jgi:hypothetical protein